MSYCRFSEGKVYMFDHVDGFIRCCACRLGRLTNKGFRNQDFQTARDALEHLLKHRKAGHKVPDHAFEELRQEVSRQEQVGRVSKPGKTPPTG